MIDEEYLSKVKGVYEVRGAAGSGKTTQLVKDIKKLQSMNKRIAVISYSNAAVDELDSRIGNTEILLSTIHSFCWRILKPVSSRILEKFINTGVFIPETLRNESKTVFKSIKVIKYGELGYPNFNEKTGELWLSHNDVIDLFILSLDKIPKFSQIIGNSFKYILIDEYQDTNGKFLDVLFKKLSKLLVIGIYGDPYQSVFLNNDSLIISSVRKEYEITKVYLENNYRSQGRLVDLFNADRTSYDNLIQGKIIDPGNKVKVIVGERSLSSEDVDAINSTMGFSNSVVLSLTNVIRTRTAGFETIAKMLKQCTPSGNLDWPSVLRIDQLNGYIRLILEYSKIFYGSDYDSIHALCTIFSKESIKELSLSSISEFISNSKDNYCGMDSFISFGLELKPEFKDSQEWISIFTKNKLLDVYSFYDSLQGINNHSMTIYSSKGLEFDNVILNIDYGHYRSRNWNQINFDHKENDVLDIDSDIMSYLFYVGITRAKKNLVIYINGKLHSAFLEKFKSKFPNLKIKRI